MYVYYELVTPYKLVILSACPLKSVQYSLLQAGSACP
jgi:hypothetical protein